MSTLRTWPRWSVLLLAALGGCRPSTEFMPAARAAVGDTIRAEAEKVIAALASKDVDQLVALFTPDSDFVYVDNGRIYPDRPALRAAASGFFQRLGSATGQWDPVHVLPLSPSSGAFTGVFRPQMVDTAGTPLWVEGKIWTFVYERRAGQWLIVQAHEVNALPPR
jgi:uncharacterized protein (TIGR02246 family)